MEFLVTTVPGLDKLAIEEISGHCAGQVSFEHKGMIRIRASLSEGLSLHYRSKMIHKIYLKLAEGTFEQLQELYDRCYAIPLEDYLHPAQEFASRASRSGSHSFTSPEVEKLCGEAIIERMRDKTGKRIPVNLDNPEVIIHTLVRKNHFWIGLEATGSSLHRRFYRAHHHPAALNPVIAHAMVRLSGWEPGETLADPMCGSGTIPIEAAHWRHQIGNKPENLLFYNFSFLDEASRITLQTEQEREIPKVQAHEVCGSDLYVRHVNYARKLARMAHAEVPFSVADATTARLDYDRIVCNPPYGMRIGNRAQVKALYEAFLENLFYHRWKRTILLTGRPDLIPRELVHWAHYIDYGNLSAAILIIHP